MRDFHLCDERLALLNCCGVELVDEEVLVAGFEVFDDIIDGLTVLIKVVSTQDETGSSAL